MQLILPGPKRLKQFLLMRQSARKKAGEDGFAFYKTEAYLRLVVNHRMAERIWREILEHEEDDELKTLYQRRLDAAQAESELLP